MKKRGNKQVLKLKDFDMRKQFYELIFKDFCICFFMSIFTLERLALK